MSKKITPVAKLIGAIPNRLQLAGGWIDQPFVNKYDPKPPGAIPYSTYEAYSAPKTTLAPSFVRSTLPEAASSPVSVMCVEIAPFAPIIGHSLPVRFRVASEYILSAISQHASRVSPIDRGPVS